MEELLLPAASFNQLMKVSRVKLSGSVELDALPVLVGAAAEPVTSAATADDVAAADVATAEDEATVEEAGADVAVATAELAAADEPEPDEPEPEEAPAYRVGPGMS